MRASEGNAGDYGASGPPPNRPGRSECDLLHTLYLLSPYSLRDASATQAAYLGHRLKPSVVGGMPGVPCYLGCGADASLYAPCKLRIDRSQKILALTRHDGQHQILADDGLAPCIGPFY